MGDASSRSRALHFLLAPAVFSLALALEANGMHAAALGVLAVLRAAIVTVVLWLFVATLVDLASRGDSAED